MSKKQQKSSELEKAAADGDGSRGVPGAIAGAILAPLVGAPKNIGGALEDLRSIAVAVQVLPKVLKSLERIEKHVASLDEEVIIMRAGVESIGTRVDGLGASIEHLAQGLEDVAANVEGLEPHLIEMRGSLQPIKRARGRIGRANAAARGETREEPAGD